MLIATALGDELKRVVDPQELPADRMHFLNIRSSSKVYKAMYDLGAQCTCVNGRVAETFSLHLKY